MSIFKSKLAKQITSIGAVFALAGTLGMAVPTNANAGNVSIDLRLGNGTGIYFNGNRRAKHHNRRARQNQRRSRKVHRRDYNPRYYDPSPRYQPRPRRNICGPRRAVNKAYRLGLNDAQVRRVGERRTVVVGYQYGYRTRMVFKRYSNCKLLKTVRFN